MRKLSVLIIGQGGREHAIAWKLAQSVRLGKLYISPGNSGTAQLGENVSIDLKDNSNVVDFAKKNNIDLVVVTPDDYLAAGMVDALIRAGTKAFGPTKAASKIEWSKAFAKDLMKKAKIPTAMYETFTDYEKAKKYLDGQSFPLVIKASGLALGKGAVIASSRKEAEKILHDMMIDKIFGESGKTVVIEEFLQGAEISIHAFCDGKTAVLFPSSQDHKQIFDNDQGPNTGGMGTIAPVEWVTPALMSTVKKTVVDPILKALSENGTPFSGLLYPGLMITKDGPKVIEFNARFGDPEAQSYMRLLDTDLLDIFISCSEGTLAKEKIRWKRGFACCIVIASKGYPETSEKGVRISGIKSAELLDNVVVYHAGAKEQDGAVVTNGGRVLGVTVSAGTLNGALKKAYNGVSKIKFPGMQYRHDIGRRKPPI